MRYLDPLGTVQLGSSRKRTAALCGPIGSLLSLFGTVEPYLDVPKYPNRTLGLQVYRYYPRWTLKHIDMTYFGP